MRSGERDEVDGHFAKIIRPENCPRSGSFMISCMTCINTKSKSRFRPGSSLNSFTGYQKKESWGLSCWWNTRRRSSGAYLPRLRRGRPFTNGMSAASTSSIKRFTRVSWRPGRRLIMPSKTISPGSTSWVWVSRNANTACVILKRSFGGELVNYGRFARINNRIFYAVAEAGYNILSLLKKFKLTVSPQITRICAD